MFALIYIILKSNSNKLKTIILNQTKQFKESGT